jgi:hypothetical protein
MGSSTATRLLPKLLPGAKRNRPEGRFWLVSRQRLEL